MTDNKNVTSMAHNISIKLYSYKQPLYIRVIANPDLRAEGPNDRTIGSDSIDLPYSIGKGRQLSSAVLYPLL